MKDKDINDFYFFTSEVIGEMGLPDMKGVAENSGITVIPESDRTELSKELFYLSNGGDYEENLEKALSHSITNRRKLHLVDDTEAEEEDSQSDNFAFHILDDDSRVSKVRVATNITDYKIVGNPINKNNKLYYLKNTINGYFLCEYYSNKIFPISEDQVQECYIGTDDVLEACITNEEILVSRVNNKSVNSHIINKMIEVIRDGSYSYNALLKAVQSLASGKPSSQIIADLKLIMELKQE